MSELVVLNLGGSIFNPGEIAIPLVLEFRKLMYEQVKAGKKFLIILGGGAVSRQYQKKAREAGITDADALDEIGLWPTRVNAIWCKWLLSDYATSEIVTSFDELITFTDKPIVLGGGTAPGWSTDYVALRWAKQLGLTTAISMGSAPYVYNKDFMVHKDAEPYKALTWSQYLAISGTERTPGMHAPIDPIAAQYGQDHKLQAYVIGPSMDNLASLLDHKPFEGTIIS
ncbi:MAG: Aspartate/glutamate/uridylate kinase [Parcubacteria group bacterium GW2011_GWA2_47_8]|nr:MAG: Aspartate/glutamate/uridylate kinase [Parcubacteria group bacterium GW2011_GWA2_47_8]OHB20523.1 MAG: hypothetical protein A2666_03605 [Parcubacteria group bacterium RIFCSPHIGHO2_01_FULL_47_10b]